jgi:pimeloyl-ACP methyl ester carboxylesterase
MDALRIEKVIIAGCDWGARTANFMAALWPSKAMVSVSGYLIGSQAIFRMPLPPQAELEWWYQYDFATERGRAGYTQHTGDFAKLILAARIAKVGLRRSHLRSQRGGFR